MGRRRWQHYQQLLMENVHLKDEGKQMEEKDWESSDKCNFCDENSNTSQQKVDNTVSESQEQSKTQNHSSESSYETEDSEEDTVERTNSLNFQRSPYTLSNIPESLYFTKTPLNSMSSFDSVAPSVAASMAAVAAMNMQKSLGSFRFLPNASIDMVPPWYLPATNLKLETASRRKDVETENVDEQPLDLSAKSCSPLNSPAQSPVEAPSPTIPPLSAHSNLSTTSSSSLAQNLKVSILNTNRHIFKAKPRLSSMAGRRTYTEEELQAALQDIQSGKLGTRRAAVIYGIPRSTLRNKVYKLEKEKVRDNNLLYQPLSMESKRIDEGDVPSDDKEGSEEREDEDEEVEKELLTADEDKDSGRQFNKPVFTVEDLIRFSKQSASPLVENDSLRALLQHGSKIFAEQALKQEKDPTGQAQIPPPLYSIFPPGATEIWGNLDAASITPYLTHFMAVTRDNFNINSLLGHQNPYFIRNQSSPNDSPTDASPAFSSKFSNPLLPELMQRMLAESEEQKKKENSAKTSQESAFSLSAENNQDEQRSSPSNLLHRLPMFKPPYKNGSTPESNFGNIPDYSAENRASEGSERSMTSSPPPMSAARSDSSSPSPANHKVGLNLRDAIAKSMGHRFQQPQDMPMSHIPGTSSLDGLNRVSFSGLSTGSLKRNHGESSDSSDAKKLCIQVKVPLSSSAPNTGTATSGKGTRPKRGKYRNYDRDSLVEAVRAVQRGEMSVHRAGSYYGVPHSTLEYKVKERHLMRPRKREPKNPPDDLKRREDGSVLRLSMNEKPAQHSPSQQPKLGKPSFTPPASLPTTPNGLKIPGLFETPHPFAPTAPFPFWSAPFHQLAMDYSRNTAGFPANPEHLLASQFVQRMQEESAKNNQMPHALATGLGKNTREVAESLYDGSGLNGSFLDGVIRSSLDNEQTFSEHVQRKNLLEQLYRNQYLNPAARQQSSESDDDSGKPNINHILAHTLLSTVAKDIKESASRSVDDENSNDKAEQSSLDEERNGNVKSEESASSNVQNLSFNSESHSDVEIKTEKN